MNTAMIFEDELTADELVAYKAAEAAKVVAPKGTSDHDVDWDDSDATSSDQGLKRIVPKDKNLVVRVAVLTDIVSAKHDWLHFVVGKDGKKTSARCLSVRDKKQVIQGEPGICCQILNNDDQQKAQHVFAVLALEYRNADPKTGKFMVNPTTHEVLPISYEIGWLKLSESGFKAIAALTKEDEDGPSLKPHEMDIVVSFRDNGIGYNYNRATRAARYRANPALLAEVQAEASKYTDGVKLTRWLGKKIPPIEWRILLSGSSDRKSPADIDNCKDL